MIDGEIEIGEKVYCQFCKCYLGEFPIMLQDEYGRATRLISFCPNCGAALEFGSQQKVPKKDIDEWFAYCWEIYPRKENKVKARHDFEAKLPKVYEDAHQAARKIYAVLIRYVEQWEEENRDAQYIPYFSSWLNANFQTAKKKTSKRSKK